MEQGATEAAVCCARNKTLAHLRSVLILILACTRTGGAGGDGRAGGPGENGGNGGSGGNGHGGGKGGRGGLGARVVVNTFSAHTDVFMLLEANISGGEGGSGGEIGDKGRGGRGGDAGPPRQVRWSSLREESCNCTKLE